MFHSETTLNGFQDILRERRTRSDFMWATRDWNPACVYVQSRKPSPNTIKSKVYSSNQLNEVIQKLCTEVGLPVEQQYKVVSDILNEVSYARVVPVLRWLGFFTSKILKRMCSEVLLNEEMFLKVKSQFGKNPVLFVPSHRSYGDFILMSYICFHFELDIPRIAAGMDFRSMTFMGRILRDSCAFFMRRSFTNDKLYSATFSQYVQTLVMDGDAAIEFFIEGTRSRTAKSLVPKYGFLTMALKPFLTGRVPDITLVPINLSYDRVMEEILFVYELLGVPKPKESTKGFLKALNILKENYGNVYVHVGEPVSAWEFFRDKTDRSIHNVGPVQLQNLHSSESRHIVRLAHRIVRKQQDLTVLTCFNLIALVLNHHIMTSSCPMTLTELVSRVTWLVPIVRGLGATVAMGSDVLRAVLSHLSVHRNMVVVTSDKKIKLLRIHSRADHTSGQARTKGHRLSCQTMDAAVPLLLVQYYANPCAHFVVNLAFVIVIVECVKSGAISEGEVRAGFKFLTAMFWDEFAFDSESEEDDFKAALDFARTWKAVAVVDSSELARGDDKDLRLFGVTFCKLYISGYLVAMEVLLKMSSEPSLSRTTIHKSYQETVESLMKAGVTIHPAALSLDMISNAIQAFVRLGGVRKDRRGDQTVYRVDRERLQEIHSELKSFDVMRNRPGVDLTEHFSNFVNGKL